MAHGQAVGFLDRISKHVANILASTDDLAVRTEPDQTVRVTYVQHAAAAVQGSCPSRAAALRPRRRQRQAVAMGTGDGLHSLHRRYSHEDTVHRGRAVRWIMVPAHQSRVLTTRRPAWSRIFVRRVT